MKIIIRILMILLASMLVVGATYLLGDPNGASPPPRGEFEQVSSQDSATSNATATTNQGNPPEARRQRRPEGGRGAQGFSLQGLLGFMQTLLPMALIIGLVTWGEKVIKRRKKIGKLAVNV